MFGSMDHGHTGMVMATECRFFSEEFSRVLGLCSKAFHPLGVPDTRLACSVVALEDAQPGIRHFVRPTTQRRQANAVLQEVLQDALSENRI